jgi:hypothetical protein
MQLERRTLTLPRAASIERGIVSECWQHILLQVTEALAKRARA